MKGVVIQVANIVSGFMLAAPKLQEFGAKEKIANIHAKLGRFTGIIGVIELILGVLALIERMGLAYFPVPDFGASYPQSLPAIAMGLILSGNIFAGFPAIQKFTSKLTKYAVPIGMTGIAVGLGSLLFGCPLCIQ